MKIRKAQETDYKELMQLYNEFVKEKRYSNYDNDSFKEVLNSPNNFIYIAEDKEKLIGFATFSLRRVIRYPKAIAELDELFVMPEYRKKGVGKKLMMEILNKAREMNCYRLFIESHYNHKEAHKFYASLGLINYGYHFIKDL